MKEASFNLWYFCITKNSKERVCVLLFTVLGTSGAERHVRHRLACWTLGPMAPRVFHLLRVQRAASGPDILLPRRKTLLRTPPRRNPQAALLRLWWGNCPRRTTRHKRSRLRLSIALHILFLHAFSVHPSLHRIYIITSRATQESAHLSALCGN